MLRENIPVGMDGDTRWSHLRPRPLAMFSGGAASPFVFHGRADYSLHGDGQRRSCPVSSSTGRSRNQPPATVSQRSTRQRAAIMSALADSEGFVSAQDLHASIRQHHGSVGLSTVYRSLQALAESGDIDVIVKSDGEAVYRHCGQGSGHHHHLMCRECGVAVKIQGPAVERWAEAVAREQGFVDVSHTLDLFGTCRRCARVRKKSRGQ